MTEISRENVNVGENPGVYRTTLKGKCLLPPLPEGGHNVTVYLVANHAFSLITKFDPGDIIYSATTEFKIEPFPTALVAVASVVSVVLVGIGLLVYFRKRKIESGIKHA